MLREERIMKVMGEVQEGICGAHQGGTKMCWLIRRYGYFWPTIMKDCIKYSKRCEACQRHGPIQQAPSVAMNPVIKPWPFRGWAMDLIGKIYPASNIALSLWLQTISPRSITTDKGSSFISREMLDMAKVFKFKLLQSTAYYAQANGQAESNNKVIINIIRKMLEKNPKQWHEKLS
ncbi:hypothetical protein L3X38_003801 [Prunus dulcis]|uniref:Integrase catalytic domain-containing protein n=1 Tax=Prunus dulcis TaxID=3755 RepID=A0AAD4ZMS5_PRUDU|nr:hypothetical protein L3X38_003801 [Prunus dulcis]